MVLDIKMYYYIILNDGIIMTMHILVVLPMAVKKNIHTIKI